MGHVTGGVNVDEPANAGDDQHHDYGELVQLQIEARTEISRSHPGEVLFVEKDLAGVEKLADRFERAEERQTCRADSRDDYVFVGPLCAQQPVDCGAKQRQ